MHDDQNSYVSLVRANGCQHTALRQTKANVHET